MLEARPVELVAPLPMSSELSMSRPTEQMWPRPSMLEARPVELVAPLPMSSEQM
jgi:hypothetical protein